MADSGGKDLKSQGTVDILCKGRRPTTELHGGGQGCSPRPSEMYCSAGQG